MQCKYLTPTSTIHKISKEISGLLTNYQLELKTAIQNSFSSTQHLTPDAINSIKSIIESTLDTDEDMDADHTALLYHTQVRWMSKGNMLSLIFEPREEVKLFLVAKQKHDLLLALVETDFLHT